MFSSLIQKLVALFSKFPTVGPRTASRFVFYLIKMPQDEFDNFINSIKSLKESVKICPSCFNPFEADKDRNLCPICSDSMRDKTALCLVEKETDLLSIEKAKKYNGLYFVLGDTVPIFKKETDKKAKISELEERVKNSQFKEIIIAINPTTKGEATILYIERKLKSLGLPPEKMPKITRLARGLPVGGELEYADEETLKSAFDGRK